MKKSFTTRPLPPPPDEDVPSQRGLLILVVDDMVDNLALISLDLQLMGYRVVTATGGEQAIRVARQTNPNIILMDLAMPGTDGLEASRKIHEDENLRHIPLLEGNSDAWFVAHVGKGEIAGINAGIKYGDADACPVER